MRDRTPERPSAYDRLSFTFAAHFPAPKAERMATVALQSLETAGFRVVRQEQVGWTDTGRAPNDTPDDWYFRYEDEQVSDDARPVWRDR